MNIPFPLPGNLEITLVAALSRNRVIGKDNTLPWHLPADLKHFRELTTGFPIIMGRRTWESLGKPLPRRTNIVLSHHKPNLPPPVLHAPTLSAAYQIASQFSSRCFVIGGGQLYQETIKHAHRLELTQIEIDCEGDTFFPEVKNWTCIHQEQHKADAQNLYNYTFQRYIQGQ